MTTVEQPHTTGTIGKVFSRLRPNVAAIILVLLGGTTWLSGGFWAPDGAYSRLISPIIGLGWVGVVSWVLLTRSPATRAGW